MSSDPRQRLQDNLGYRFADRSLLERALTHRSLGAENNERLEFLGDAVLSFLVAEALHGQDVAAPEGRLTRLRASLVCRETLAEMARDVEIGPCLRLGGGELKSGGRDRDSILADAFEALVGAVYLDGHFDACRTVVADLFAGRLARALAGDSLKDAKTRLQEILQARGEPLPVYRVTGVDGADHAQRFTVECALDDLGIVTVGTGRSRRGAEQSAAARAYQRVSEVVAGEAKQVR